MYPALEFYIRSKTTGPGCSKLTTSSVNVSLKFPTLSQIHRYFLWEAFALKQLLSFFQQKYQCIWLKVVKRLMGWPLNELFSWRCFEQLSPGLLTALLSPAMILEIKVITFSHQYSTKEFYYGHAILFFHIDKEAKYTLNHVTWANVRIKIHGHQPDYSTIQSIKK